MVLQSVLSCFFNWDSWIFFWFVVIVLLSICRWRDSGSTSLIRRVFASILDVEELEVSRGEMRDVIKVDRISEGLLAALFGPVFALGFRYCGPAGWTSLVQRHRTALDWWIFNGCCSGQQFTWGSKPDWVRFFELTWFWSLWNICWGIWRSRWAWDITLHQWSLVSAFKE